MVCIIEIALRIVQNLRHNALRIVQFLILNALSEVQFIGDFALWLVRFLYLCSKKKSYGY